MKSRSSTRHHYIPQFILRNFLDQRGHIWVFDRERDRVYATTPKNVFVQSNLYATYTWPRERIPADCLPTDIDAFVASFSKDASIETDVFANGIEKEAAPVVSRIIDAARSGRCPRLSFVDVARWQRFAISQARRTPESQKRIARVGSDRDVFYEAVVRVAKRENHSLPSKSDFFADPRAVEVMHRTLCTVNASFAAGRSSHVRRQTDQFIAETGMLVAAITDRRCSFVIGSHGFAIVNTDQDKRSFSGSWFTVAPDVAIAPTPRHGRIEFITLTDHSKYGGLISKINCASTRSKIVAGRDELQIRRIRAATTNK